ncbi:MAG: hypothetical protein HY244_18360 [Rhizobiales bacterium]|nr:hypothetical protein [Hyphomicrobiales bacterium]
MLILFGQVHHARSQQNEQNLVAFGNWRITYYPSNKAFNLKAAATGEKSGTFNFQCHPGNEYALQIPLWDMPVGGEEVTKIITLWSDDHEAIDIKFPVLKGFLAAAVSSDTASRGDIEKFIEVLGSAKRFFSMSYDSKTLEFDAKHLAAARGRFFELCKTAPRP